MPSRLEVWAAQRWVRGAGLSGSSPLAEPVCTIRPASAPGGRGEREPGGDERAGEGRERWAGRERAPARQRACARGRAPAPRPARPEVPPRPPAIVTAPPLPGRRPPRALASAPAALKGLGAELEVAAPGVRGFAGTLGDLGASLDETGSRA